MNTKLVDAIANAVLYEGYMLYPYRPSSVKNRQRFNFGVLYPRTYSDAQTGSDACSMQTEFLVEQAAVSAAIEIRVRFLKLVARSVRKLVLDQSPTKVTNFESVPTLEIDGKTFAPWDEAIECEVNVPAYSLYALAAEPLNWEFAFPAKEEMEQLRDVSGQLVGLIERKQEAVQGRIEIAAKRVADEIFKVQVRVENLTLAEGDAGQLTREKAVARSLVSAHVLLGAENGRFVSLLEPPDDLKDLAANCRNVGAWPVLVGNEGERDTMLASPIILYDYPQIAPESPGDLFDGTEIDEILALRILTMTDDEKREMRGTDERARKMLERTETLPMEHLMKLHGTLRGLRSLNEGMP
jgi:hypothetical protein